MTAGRAMAHAPGGGNLTRALLLPPYPRRLVLLARSRPAEPWLSPITAEAGVYTGDFTPLALCGFVRAMGEADGNLDRLWTKCYEDAKAAGTEM